jgi:hypothetical protein
MSRRRKFLMVVGVVTLGNRKMRLSGESRYVCLAGGLDNKRLAIL